MISYDKVTGITLHISEATGVPSSVTIWNSHYPSNPLQPGDWLGFKDGNYCNPSIENLVRWSKYKAARIVMLTESSTLKVWVKAEGVLVRLDRYLWDNYYPLDLLQPTDRIEHMDGDPTNHRLSNLRKIPGNKTKRTRFLPIRREFLI
jgi:hypothetical protein